MNLFELFAEHVCLFDPLFSQALGHQQLLPLLVARDHVVELTEVKLSISVCVTSLTKKKLVKSYINPFQGLGD